MVPSISLTDAGWNTWDSRYKRYRVGNGQLQFIPKTSNSSSRNGVRQLSPGNPSRLNRGCDELTVSIAGSCTAKCHYATDWERLSSGTDRVSKLKIENVLKKKSEEMEEICGNR